jgi:hypothetical protein
MPKLTSPENALPSNIPPGWWPCFNVTDETIPGYAHVKWSRTRNDPNDENSQEFINRGVDTVNFAHRQEIVAGQPVIRIRKPLANPLDTAPGEEHDDMSDLGFFTWEHPILPHRFGLCTRALHWRALVYAIPYSDSGGWAYRVPKQAPLAVYPDNPWALYEHDGDTTQFTCMFMDATDRRSRQPAVSSSSAPAPTVCWITRAGGGE